MDTLLSLIPASGPFWLMFVTVLLFAFVIIPMRYRVIVSTNDVNIVQSRKRTISYGKDQSAGNSYYAWPAWMPLIGVKTTSLPVSVFDVKLDEYSAYDKGRVPFVIDIMAFFRIEDSNIAAQRVHSFKELTEQLQGILQGACRSILAKSEIEVILEERSKYGQDFTDATNEQLKAWGVVNVKNIELMDIRDQGTSKVIANIMAMKQSKIEMESRTAVATNIKAAQTAEIDARQMVAVRQQEADEKVGIRTAEKDQQIGVAKQKAEQEVKTQEAVTKTKEMAVVNIEQVRHAEITKEVEVVKAEQEKQVAVTVAEGFKQKTITEAEGNRDSMKLHAEGVQAEGVAKGAADTAVLMAPVNSQIALAKEIGLNDNYQAYLTTIRGIEASQAVGIKQAEALAHADVKVIATTGTPGEGMTSTMDLFSAQGGNRLVGMLEALRNSPTGRVVADKLGMSDTKGANGGREGHPRT